MASDIFLKAFENLRVGVLLLEKNTGRVTEANPAFLRMCGRPRGQVIGRIFWTPPLIDDAEAGAEIFQHLRSGGRVEAAELPLETADGSCLLLEVTGGEAGPSLVQLELRDVTSRAGARVAERVEAQRSLAARVAGEITALHQALQTAGALLAHSARQGQSTFRESDEIRKAADHAAVIARELLAYGGKLALETGPVSLNELIADIQPALQQMLGPRIELIQELAPDVSPVIADPAQLRQILLKLTANSGEAMEHGGKLRIRTANAPADDPALGRVSGDTSFAMLEVSDEGPGLDDESWQHLYEPFFTTRQHGKQGLGLAAVHGIVRQMGGRLWAHSEPGEGASFRVYLPRARAARAATILVMEQNDGLRTVVANILKKRGYRVLSARATADALEMARTGAPPDLLISEPEPDLSKFLAGLQPRLRTLFLNGHSVRPMAGAHTATLSKPFELETLLDAVKTLLQP